MLGVRLEVVPPLGQDDADKVINIGATPGPGSPRSALFM